MTRFLQGWRSLTGSSICGLTAVRTWAYQKMDYTDSTYGFAYGGMITVIEPALGILAGCIPVMAPCVKLLTRHVRSTIPHTKAGAVTRPGTGKGSDTHKSNPFTRLEDNLYPLTDIKATHVQRSMGSSTEALTETVPRAGGLGGIKVQSEIVVDVESGASAEGDSFERFKIIP
jgi:hypothetical protein